MDARCNGCGDRSWPAGFCLPLRQPTRETPAVTFAAMPGCGNAAIACDHQHDVEPFGAAQCIDRLIRGLRDGTCDIERGVDADLDADVAAKRLQIGMRQRILVRAYDLN